MIVCTNDRLLVRTTPGNAPKKLLLSCTGKTLGKEDLFITDQRDCRNPMSTNQGWWPKSHQQIFISAGCQNLPKNLPETEQKMISHWMAGKIGLQAHFSHSDLRCSLILLLSSESQISLIGVTDYIFCVYYDSASLVPIWIITTSYYKV